MRTPHIVARWFNGFGAGVNSRWLGKAFISLLLQKKVIGTQILRFSSHKEHQISPVIVNVFKIIIF